jgi:prepilin-type N-terminal cleavage/methylation domain-containing protein
MRQTNGRPCRAAFTLIELLVVVAVISLLVSILLPTLSQAKKIAKRVTCLTRVAGQLTAVHMYAAANDGVYPSGPGFPDPYFHVPVNEVATNNIWMGPAQTFNAHGALLLRYLEQPEAFFCPDDDSSDPVEEVEKVRRRLPELAFCSYLYRQLDAQVCPTDVLDQLGFNARGDRVRALVMDMNSLMPIPGVPTRTNHDGLRVSVGFVDGGARSFHTPDGELTMRPQDAGRMAERLDEVLEHADALAR